MWFKTLQGNVPAKEFYESCNDKVKGVFLSLFNHLKNHTILNIPKATDFLDKVERILELRVRHDGKWYRITFSYANDCILSSGFTKDQNKTPLSEIKLAILRKKEYLKYKNSEEVIY